MGGTNTGDGVQNKAEVSARLQADVHRLNFHTSWNCEKGFCRGSVGRLDHWPNLLHWQFKTYLAIQHSVVVLFICLFVCLFSLTGSGHKSEISNILYIWLFCQLLFWVTWRVFASGSDIFLYCLRKDCYPSVQNVRPQAYHRPSTSSPDAGNAKCPQGLLFHCRGPGKFKHSGGRRET